MKEKTQWCAAAMDGVSGKACMYAVASLSRKYSRVPLQLPAAPMGPWATGCVRLLTYNDPAGAQT